MNWNAQLLINSSVDTKRAVYIMPNVSIWFTVFLQVPQENIWSYVHLCSCPTGVYVCMCACLCLCTCMCVPACVYACQFLCINMHVLFLFVCVWQKGVRVGWGWGSYVVSDYNCLHRPVFLDHKLWLCFTVLFSCSRPHVPMKNGMQKNLWQCISMSSKEITLLSLTPKLSGSTVSYES